jgi:hypothetical protein
MQLTMEMFPTLRGAAVLWDRGGAADQWLATQKTGSELGMELLGIEMQTRPYDL